MRIDDLPPLVARHAREMRLTWPEVDQHIMDFFETNPEYLLQLEHQLAGYFKNLAQARAEAMVKVTKSLVIEHAKRDCFRAIVFESDWQESTSVHDIAEHETLSGLKKWFTKNCKDVRCVRIGHGDNREVSDVWLTAVCLMRPKEE